VLPLSFMGLFSSGESAVECQAGNDRRAEVLAMWVCR
jgi:hypothetical protein